VGRLAAVINEVETHIHDQQEKIIDQYKNPSSGPCFFVVHNHSFTLIY